MQKEFKTIEEVKKFLNTLVKEKDYIINVNEQRDGSGFTVEWQDRKTYTGLDGKEYPEEAWFTKSGKIIQIQDLSEVHMRNIIRKTIRNSRTSAVAREELASAIENLLSNSNFTQCDSSFGLDDIFDFEDTEISPTIH